MKNYDVPASALADLKNRGYEADFETGSFCLYCGDLDMRLYPEEFKVDEEYRFEGDPNHEEDIVVIAITSYTGTKGVLVDSYESYSGDMAFDIAKMQRHFMETFNNQGRLLG
jgi:hypothetical protein